MQKAISSAGFIMASEMESIFSYHRFQNDPEESPAALGHIQSFKSTQKSRLDLQLSQPPERYLREPSSFLGGARNTNPGNPYTPQGP